MPTGIYNHKSCSEETKRKISEAKKGWNPSLITRINMSKAKRGLFLSKSHKLAISKAISGSNNPRWKGGWTHTEGYFSIHMPNHPYADSKGYIMEHRIVVEKIIKRYLNPKEIVHHLKETNNNNPKYLMAFINQKAHLNFHQGKEIDSKEIIFDGRKL